MTYDEIFALGRKALGSEDYDDAISNLTNAIALNPKLPFSYSFRGVAYAEQGKSVEAMADYIKVILLQYQWLLLALGAFLLIDGAYSDGSGFQNTHNKYADMLADYVLTLVDYIVAIVRHILNFIF
ncbi:tetratricopeptide repeat protein [Weissella minor]|uniref:Uncharacterized protein n=1 Tax=Weissella minor TaxID=1620 RepID=A0A0R2JRT4_9LACO|nr:tetratricopeptide repeat protein [Weissella minor]KRN77306.1 hypothetical protein IV67_GL001661 [Weissella minor]